MQISLFFIHCALTQQHGEESTIMIWTGDKEVMSKDSHQFLHSLADYYAESLQVFRL